MAEATTFQWPLRVYWEDTDAGGIVFYANYLKFFERSRTEWLRSLGIEQHSLRESTGGMFVVTETSIRYHRPARLDDELIVTATLIEKGRASLIIRQSTLLKSEHSGLSGENQFSDGPPLGKLAPSGSSALREAKSVGAIQAMLRMVHISSASQTMLSSTRVTPLNLNTPALSRSSVTSMISWSPGSTGRLKRAPSMPAK